MAGFCGFCGLNTPIVAFLIFSTVWLECVIYLFSPSTESAKGKKKVPEAFVFFSLINRCNRFRQALNESEMRHCVVLILTVILPPGINLSPVVADPDNAAELKDRVPAQQQLALKAKGKEKAQIIMENCFDIQI